MDIRNELKSYIVREGMTMRELVDMLSFEYGWSDSVPKLFGQTQPRLSAVFRSSRNG